MIKILAILGSGELGRQIAHIALSDKHYSKVVFFDDFSNEKKVNGIEIAGTSDDIESEYSKKSFHELIIGVGYKHLTARKSLFERFIKLIPFATIIHSTCWVDSSAVIKPGTILYPNCCIDAYVIVDANVILNLGCTIAHNTFIGSHSFLSPRVAIAGFVKIEELCFIGINSTIIDNICITKATRLGGASLVTKNIIQSGSYVGSPVRYLK